MDAQSVRRVSRVSALGRHSPCVAVCRASKPKTPIPCCQTNACRAARSIARRGFDGSSRALSTDADARCWVPVGQWVLLLGAAGVAAGWLLVSGCCCCWCWLLLVGASGCWWCCCCCWFVLQGWSWMLLLETRDAIARGGSAQQRHRALLSCNKDSVARACYRVPRVAPCCAGRPRRLPPSTRVLAAGHFFFLGTTPRDSSSPLCPRAGPRRAEPDAAASADAAKLRGSARRATPGGVSCIPAAGAAALRYDAVAMLPATVRHASRCRC